MPVTPDTSLRTSSHLTLVALCVVQAVDSCLLECGHAVLCFYCASMLARQVPNSCPLCRVPIRCVVRLTTTLSRAPLRSRVTGDSEGERIRGGEGGGRVIAVSGEGYSVNTDVVQIFSSVRAGRTVALTPTI